MITLWLAWVGVAEAHEIRLCGQWTPQYAEGSALDEDGYDLDGDGIVDNDRPDFLTSNDPQPLRGMWLVAEAQSPTGGWAPAWQGFAPATGPNAGCTDLFTPIASGPLGHSIVRMHATSAISVGGHVVSVRNNPQDDTVVVREGWGYPTITSSGRYDASFGSSDTRMDLAIALAWALAREDGDVPAMTLTAYASPSVVNGGSSGGGQYNHPQRTLYVGSQNKMKVAFHELGHAIRAHAGIYQPPFSYTWDQADDAVSNCANFFDSQGAGHWITSDEATPTAINEGFASYYAAVILNRTDEEEAFLLGQYDWDGDEVLDDGEFFAIDRQPSKQATLTMPMAYKDWWANRCAPQSVSNLSTEYDWLRGFWDLDTDHGLTLPIILDVLVLAVDATSGAWATEVDGCSTFCPWALVQGAADSLDDASYGLQDDYIRDQFATQCANNGLCR